MRQATSIDAPVRWPVPARIAVLACAASAGVHAGLVPEHLREEPRLGLALIGAVVLLVLAAAGLVINPAEPRIARAAALLLGGLIVAYAASRTTGIPLLAPEREPVDAVGVTTNVVEALGVAAALHLGQLTGRRARRPSLQEVSR